jgi:hypothetical protein
MADIEKLKATIPGWGADLDPKDRPAVPMERTPPRNVNVSWTEPERQEPRVRILKSPEHPRLTPVFGTAQPPKLLSGLIRRFAYTYSEGKKAHWLLLLLADRVDEVEESLKSVLTLSAHNPLKEMGLQAELKRHPFRSRFGQHRGDVRRQVIYLGLLSAVGGMVFMAIRRRRRRPALELVVEAEDTEAIA